MISSFLSACLVGLVCSLCVHAKRGETATFAGGSFLRLRKVFSQVPGISGSDVIIGYTGGWKSQPNYTEVCLGMTGHSEAVQVSFQPQNVSYELLLRLFFNAHDPFSKNQQGDLIGTQYRSVIYVHNDKQEKLAKAFINDFMQRSNKTGLLTLPITTEVLKAEQFWPETAEDEELSRIQAEVNGRLKAKMDFLVAELKKNFFAEAEAAAKKAAGQEAAETSAAPQITAQSETKEPAGQEAAETSPAPQITAQSETKEPAGQEAAETSAPTQVPIPIIEQSAEKEQSS